MKWLWKCLNGLLDRLCGLTDVAVGAVIDDEPPRVAGDPGGEGGAPPPPVTPCKPPRVPPSARLKVKYFRDGWRYAFILPSGRHVGEVKGKPYSTKRNAIEAARRVPGYAAMAKLEE